MKNQIIRECKFALCHYNKTKKSSMYHFAALNLKNVIRIIPPGASTTQQQPQSSYSIAPMQPPPSPMLSTPSSSVIFTQSAITTEPKPFTPFYIKNKTPQLQHENL